MRHALALVVGVLLLSLGCSKRNTYYSTMSTPTPPVETMPLWNTTGPLRVGVDPYLEPDRQRTLFDADFRERGILPLLVVIHNQGTEPLRLRRSAITLSFPDATERQPLPVATVVGKPPKFTPREQTTHPDDHPAVFAVIATIGLAHEPANQARRRAWEARRADYEAKMFPDTIATPDAKVHGFVFFILPDDHDFKKAALTLQVETRTSSDIRVQVPLRHLK